MEITLQCFVVCLSHILTRVSIQTTSAKVTVGAFNQFVMHNRVLFDLACARALVALLANSVRSEVRRWGPLARGLSAGPLPSPGWEWGWLERMKDQVFLKYGFGVFIIASCS